MRLHEIHKEQRDRTLACEKLLIEQRELSAEATDLKRKLETLENAYGS